MGKCKFCDGGVGNMPTEPLWREDVLMWLADGIVASLDIFVEEKEPTIMLTVGNKELEAKIKYCPMCGRDLEADYGK